MRQEARVSVSLEQTGQELLRVIQSRGKIPNPGAKDLRFAFTSEEDL